MANFASHHFSIYSTFIHGLYMQHTYCYTGDPQTSTPHRKVPLASPCPSPRPGSPCALPAPCRRHRCRDSGSTGSVLGAPPRGVAVVCMCVFWVKNSFPPQNSSLEEKLTLSDRAVIREKSEQTSEVPGWCSRLSERLFQLSA